MSALPGVALDTRVEAEREILFRAVIGTAMFDQHGKFTHHRMR